MRKIYWIPIEENFIENFTDKFLKENKNDKNNYSDTAIVFPNKRPFLFLRKAMAKKLKASFIPPKSFTMDEFVYFITEKKYPGLKLINSIDAVWIIWKIIQNKNILSEKQFINIQSDFEKFMPWGERIFRFINQADTENIENKVLTSVQENAEIGYEMPEQINILLEKIVQIREEFHKYLEMNEKFTRGYSYLKAYKIINDITFPDFNKIYFSGLFALTGVEQQIIYRLWQDNRAEIIWNGNPADWNEILGRLYEKFKPAQLEELSVNKKFKTQYHFHAAFDFHSEVVQSYEVLKETQIENTAVILPRADTLFPLLSIVVDRLKKLGKVDNFNISLQYPLIRTSLFSLISEILNAQKNIRERAGKIYYNAGLYVNILSHPFIKNLHKKEYAVIRIFVNYIKAALKEEVKDSRLNGKIYINLDEIEQYETVKFLSDWNIPDNINQDENKVKSIIGKLHTIIFKNFENINKIAQVTDYIEDFINLIIDASPVKSYVLSGEIFNALFNLLEELKKIEFANESFNKEFVLNFILSYLKEQGISFSTTPLQNLEIIGMLETRNLNFKNVFIFDVQDDVIPGEKKIDPLIPIELYKQFNMPDYNKQEEMNRYYFERIIKSAENVHLFYIENEDNIRSRYIEKLIWEKEKKGEKYNIDKISIPISNIKTSETGREIIKSESVIEKLNSFVFSASNLDTYIKCGIKFYFSNILDLAEEDEIAEELDAGARGTIIHKILSEIFEEAKNRKNYFNSERIDELLDISAYKINEYFKNKRYSGKIILLEKIISIKLKDFIKFNLSQEPFSIYKLEKDFKAVYDTGMHKVNIKGYIDRIDKDSNGNFIIIDYKSGSQKRYSNVWKINELEFDINNMEDINKSIASIQLPFYIYLLTKDRDNIKTVSDAKYLFFIAEQNKMELSLFKKADEKAKEDIYKSYLEVIDTLINDILDPAKPFRKWEKTECENCEFYNLCMKV